MPDRSVPIRQPPGAPRVSVLLPAYNAEATIDEAIRSVLEQTLADLELIVVDDGSSDATVDGCQAHAADARLRIIRLPSNQGRPAARNTALAAARGTYVAMLDADDRCLPERLATQADYLDTHPQVDVVASWWQGMDDSGRLRAKKRNQRRLDIDTVNCWLLFRGIIHNPTVMARRAALAGFAYDPAFPVAQDYDVWARMQLAGHRFAQIPDVLVHYRQHAGQASTARASEARARRCDIQARLLSSLGMSFTRDDVIRHNLLYTGRRLYEAEIGTPMDSDFLDWAGPWFERLAAANAASRFYPEPAFSDLLARLWFDCCRKAARTAGHGAVWQRFIGSPIGRRHLVRSPMRWASRFRRRSA